jgi:anti-sigma B factor antagonist
MVALYLLRKFLLDQQMEITQNSQEPRKILVYKPSGRLDALSHIEIRDEVMAIANTRPEVLVVNLEDIEFIDSRGLGLLITLLRFMRAIKSRLVICGMNKQVKILFNLTGMESIFEIHDQFPNFLDNSYESV